MKTKNLPILALLAIAGLSACHDDDGPEARGNFPADGIIRVSTQVNDPLTRAGMTTDNLPSFHLNIVNNSNSTYSYFVEMRKATGDTWNAYDGTTATTMLWQNAITPVSVTAAYKGGYTFTKAELEGTTDFELDADQSTADAIAANDLLGMPTTAVTPNADLTEEGKIAITLKHVLVKLNLRVTLGTEFNHLTGGTTTNPITALTIKGTSGSYTYTASTATATAGANSIDVTPCPGSYTPGEGDEQSAVAEYECILVPQSIAANGFLVRMTINDKQYAWRCEEDLQLEVGREYTLELTSGKEVVTLNGSITITGPWDDGPTVSITTE